MKEKRKRSQTAEMRLRAYVCMLILMAMAAAVAGKLFKTSIVDHKKYEALANGYHFGTMTIPANRGAIYDAQGTALAWSATVYNIFIDPQLCQEQFENLDKANERRKQEAGEDAQAQNIVDTQKLRETVIEFLAQKLEIDPEEIRTSMLEDSRYHILRKAVEKETADEIMEYFDKLEFSFLGREATIRRYYPQNDMAASVIGFTNGDGDGQYGLEYQYDDYLSGVDGRIISAKTANGQEMPFRNSTTYEAKDGASLTLTLDTRMQYYLEKYLKEMHEDYKVRERVCGIIMNPKTGAVLAMGTWPSFDLNQPSEICDPAAQKKLARLKDERYDEQYLIEREKQWKNKAVSEINYPGSCFKIITSAAAIEEKAVNLQTDQFDCTGSLEVADRTIYCSKREGHGIQNFTWALTNSCNPAFMEIGMRLGVDKFSYYFDGFGLTERTGIDLPNEVSSAYYTADEMSVVDLASAAFGQANELTAIELITGYAAAINGGNVVTPYIVDHVTDSSGNVILQNDTKIRRQIISSSTSATLREQLEAVVKNNPTHNAYIQGYRIGGKSGTAEKLNTVDIEDDYVSSYCCFAPADDPEVIMLLQADYPDPTVGYYGSQVVVPYATKLMKDVLLEMGYYPTYTDEEAAALYPNVPLAEGSDVQTAVTQIEKLGLHASIIGDGTSVAMQSPTAGTAVADGGTVYLYTEAPETRDLVEVPDLYGLSESQAAEILSQVGLNYVTHAGSSEEGATVKFQSEDKGARLARGSVITLTLLTESTD